MATKPCRDCNSVVSMSAETCPNCGARYPAYTVGKVCFHRYKHKVGSWVSVKVFIDGIQKVELKENETSDIFELDEGKHIVEMILCSVFNPKNSFTINVAAGVFNIINFDSGGMNSKDFLRYSISQEPFL